MRKSLVAAARTARYGLCEAVQALIRHLHWADFELFVDLLFARAEWRRVSARGGRMKDLDLVLDLGPGRAALRRRTDDDITGARLVPEPATAVGNGGHVAPRPYWKFAHAMLLCVVGSVAHLLGKQCGAPRLTNLRSPVDHCSGCRRRPSTRRLSSARRPHTFQCQYAQRSWAQL